MATLTDSLVPGGAIITSSGVTVTRDTTFFLAAGSPFDPELYYADRTGVIRRRVGRRGGGPGEYRRADHILESASEYLIVDPGLGRVTRWSKQDLELTGTTTIPMRVNTRPVAFQDGSLVIVASLPDTERALDPMHILAPDGRIIRSFGGADTMPPFMRLRGTVAPSGDTAVWAPFARSYGAELWHRDGRLLRVVERVTDWFPAAEPEPAPGSWRTRIRQLHEDAEGRLWVFITTMRMVAYEADVEDDEGGMRRVTRLRSDRAPDGHAYIVEVLDPVTGDVKASSRFEGWRASSLPGGFAVPVELAASPSGQPLIQVYGFRLVDGS